MSEDLGGLGPRDPTAVTKDYFKFGHNIYFDLILFQNQAYIAIFLLFSIYSIINNNNITHKQ